MKGFAQALTLLLYVTSLSAGDVFQPVVGEARTSEFSPEKEDDTLFVVDATRASTPAAHLSQRRPAHDSHPDPASSALCSVGVSASLAAATKARS